MEKESDFRSYLKKRLPGVTTNIETTTESGVPDMINCVKIPFFEYGVENWMELKLAKKNIVHVRKNQLNWARIRFKQGARIFLVVFWEDRILFIPMDMIIAMNHNQMGEKTLGYDMERIYEKLDYWKLGEIFHLATFTKESDKLLLLLTREYKKVFRYKYF